MCNPQITTVMGPGPSVAPNKLFDPPKLLPTTDKLVWRKKVRMWARAIKAMAKSKDAKAMSTYNTMGYTLYQSIDDSYARKLEGAISSGKLKIEMDDEEEVDPLETVEAFIKLLAKDSVTETCRREASMLKEIHACKRKDSETAAAFAHRYEDKALRYINNCDPLGAKQISQSFAVTLLDNARINPSVYSSLISQVVARANERGRQEENFMVVSRELIRKADTDAASMIEDYKKFKAENDITVPDNEDRILKIMTQNKMNMSKINKPPEAQDTSDRPSVRITLEDAAQALSEVKVEERNEKSQSPHDIPSIGTMLGKRSFAQTGEGDRNNTGKAPYDRKPKPFDASKSKCRMCKQRGHFYKDPNCIFNQVRAFLNQSNQEADSDAHGRTDKYVDTPKTPRSDAEHPQQKVRFNDDKPKKSSFFQ